MPAAELESALALRDDDDLSDRLRSRSIEAFVGGALERLAAYDRDQLAARLDQLIDKNNEGIRESEQGKPGKPYLEIEVDR